MSGFNKNAAVTFWSWNSAITREGIDGQLKDFADGKLGGVVIHARGGLKIPYMGDEWMDLFEHAVMRAAEYGLEVWIYDEEGWPSGFGGGYVTSLGEDYWHKCLHYAVGAAELPESIEQGKLVAIYDKSENGEYVLSSAENLSDAGSESIVFWYTYDSHYVDLMNPAVTQEFLKCTHEKYYERLGSYFGTVVKGFFTDEPQMNNVGYPWGVGLAAAYKEATGNDLFADLWKVAVETADSAKTKIALWDVIADLYHKSFVCGLSDWCKAHGVDLTGHFAAEDGLCEQIASCGDLMRNYSVIQFPAIDHLGSRVATPLLMKQASSVSRQYGDGSVMSETFGCAGWGVTFERLQWIWGGQSVLGITKPCYHLSAYSIEGRRKRDYPAFYSYQEPWWDEFRSFASWMNNLNTLMTEGERKLHTLVIPPREGITANYQDGVHSQDEIKRISAQCRMLAENLLDMQVDFDFGDEYLIKRDAEIREGWITLGNVSYDTVILAETSLVDEELVDILSDFAASGGRLIAINSLPENWTAAYDPLVIVNRRDTLEKFAQYLDAGRTVAALRADNLKPVNGLRLHTREIANGYRTHIWAGDSFSSQDCFVSLGEDALAYEIDLITGTKTKLPVRYSDNGVLVPLTIYGGTNRVIEFELCKDKSSVAIPVLASKCRVDDVKVTLCEKNAFTLDCAELSLDGGKTFGNVAPVIKLLDSIYERIDGRELKVALRYTFTCDETLDRNGMAIAVEDGDCKAISVNGIVLEEGRVSWWIDQCIGVYDIGQYTVPGKNTVTLHYEVVPDKSASGLLEMFETERNRFCYPIEPDSIYVLGNFDVVCDAPLCDRVYAYKLGGNFRLVPPTEKMLGDLTKQNMWFYRGNVKYSITLPPVSGVQKVLAVNAKNAVAMTLTAGEKKLVSHSCRARFDLEGIHANQPLILTVFGSNRNLMGPHHHANGESYLIGPASYEGRWDELTGFMVPELYGKAIWTDDYGVIPFGVTDIAVEVLNVENNDK